MDSSFPSIYYGLMEDLPPWGPQTNYYDGRYNIYKIPSLRTTNKLYYWSMSVIIKLLRDKRRNKLLINFLNGSKVWSTPRLVTEQLPNMYIFFAYFAAAFPAKIFVCLELCGGPDGPPFIYGFENRIENRGSGILCAVDTKLPRNSLQAIITACNHFVIFSHLHYVKQSMSKYIYTN